MDIKIVTGLSGAGKSTVLNSLEDLGYYCIDNLPPALMHQFVTMCENMLDPIKTIAIGVDVRGRHFFDDLMTQLDQFRTFYPKCQVIFLDASDKILIDRFKETRRVHPLSPDGSLIDGINLERERMRFLKDSADFLIDTTHMNARALGQAIKQQVSLNLPTRAISLTFQTFGFKTGIPMDSDLVFDVRFLPNPYYDELLRPLSGNDQEIVDYVFQWQETQTFYKKLRDMLDFLIPEYSREGKNQVIISIGCTGGRHRSVSIANRLAQDYNEMLYVTTIKHRDLK
jgi:UPF0042 nucleotide-binding protein